MSDPRLGLVTLTAVDVTKDYKIAKVYWSAAKIAPAGAPIQYENLLPSEAERADIGKALKGAGGYLKKRIGEELLLRHVPNLIFVYDSSVLTGSRIDELLGSLKS